MTGPIVARVSIAMLLLSLPAAAQEVRVDGVEIVTEGVYTTQRDPTKPDVRTDEGISATLAAWQHLRTTHIVPACKGISFGQEVRVTGAPEGTLVILRTVTIPPKPLADPLAPKPWQQMVSHGSYLIGQAGIDFYGFDENWELVPGTWRQQMWYGEKKILDVSFEVVLGDCDAISRRDGGRLARAP
ncbi:DUF3859 domain-containing protein [Methylovirgula sp. 4M-Z18]|uniref:DUF3859 domain-containing protein n=1 Tax=Methylovirgula sp. 4M-Z18 TaxID=2293567 RepID=UPI000E2FACA0|nr:DUF3859 domain-containing protein [Methylovirgula sp. 4M-Z18]RFB80045.1 DUF3859 domain-containing protein [Methylovirgula sp. 4M-Z18]